jgi:hypothetical protein
VKQPDKRNVQTQSLTVPAVVMGSVLLIYCFLIVLLFRKNSYGVKRRWHALDYVWVPLGGLTLLTLLAVLFHLR